MFNPEGGGTTKGPMVFPSDFLLYTIEEREPGLLVKIGLLGTYIRIYNIVQSERREFGELAVVAVGQLVAIVGQAVGQHHVARTDHRVISHGLCEDSPINLHVGRFALDKHLRSCIGTHDDNIGSLGRIVEWHSVLLHNRVWSNATMHNQKLYKVATHPLLGRQHQELSAHTVPHAYLVATATRAKANGRKFEFRVVVHRKMQKSLVPLQAKIRKL